MVAIRGAGWQLAPSLVRLVDEADNAYPNRSRKSDGSIGDIAHSARKSDHNPKDGYVDAVDITDSPAGPDLQAFANRLLKARDPRVKYLIHRGRIAKSYGPNAWKWTPYTGPNGHFSHLHISVTPEGRISTRPWFTGLTPDLGDPDLTPEQAQQLNEIHTALAWAVVPKVDATHNYARAIHADQLPPIGAAVNAVVASLTEHLPTLLAQGGGLGSLSDADLSRIARAVADEEARRLQG